MAKLNVVILEDDADQRSLLRRMVESSPYRSRLDVNAVSSSLILEEILDSNSSVDILITAIQLGENSQNGIDIVRRLFPAGSRTQVIYCSKYLEYCTKVYETEHVYFLLKPVKQAELNAALAKAMGALEANCERLIALRRGGKITMVPASEISYLESDKRKVRVHVVDGGPVEVYSTLSDMMEMLPKSFAQCHKSFIVNMDLIDELSAARVRLRSGEEVPVSQRQRKQLHDSFYQYLSLSN